MAFSQGDQAGAEVEEAEAKAKIKSNEPNPDEWLTDEIRGLLRAIRGEHAAKKRITVIKLAFARANGIPVKRVFDQEDTCAEVIWYTKWVKNPVIKTAYESCFQRALEWVDEQTAAQEMSFRQARRRAMARYASQAPKALATVMNDENKSGGVRISAANALLTWVTVEEGKGESPGKKQPMDVKDLSDDELAAIATGGGD
jgi:hypothetical protein